MWETEQIIIMAVLTAAAFWDIRHREFPAIWIICLGTAAAGWSSWSRIPPSDIIIGLLFGVSLVFISFLTKQSLGYADSTFILILAVLTESSRLLTIVWLSFLLCAAVSVPLLIRDRSWKKQRMPFLPFLAAGYIGGIILL